MNHFSFLKDIIDFIDFKTNSKLIFIGDTAQLPPVNQTISPALNSDFLKNSYNLKINEYEIIDVVRQTEESGILYNATEIRNCIINNELNFKFKKFNDIISLLDGFEIQESIEKSFNEMGRDNSIIIVDEAHNLTGNEYGEALKKIIKQSKNLRVVLLTATPMFNTAT